MLRRCFFLLVLATLAAPPVAAQPVVTCNDTWAEISSALSAATTTPGNHVIRVVQGTYTMTSSPDLVLHPDASVQLLGGYTAGCAGRTIDPANTTITGQGLRALRLDASGDILIEGLTMRNLAGFANGREGGLDIICRAPDGGNRDVLLTHNAFSQIDGTFAGVAAYGDGPCLLAFRNNLVGPIGAPPGGSVFFGVSLCSGLFDGSRRGELVDQNTFVQINASGAGGARAALNVCLTGTVARNVFRFNLPRDLDLFPGNAINVVRNLYDLVPSDPIGGQNTGNFNADPMFVNAGADNFRLQPASPAVNAGTTFTDIARDLDGNPRRVGSRTDLGAYETNVDDLTQLVVTNTSDNGPGSLRQAILDANANPNHNLIRFALPGACGSQGILLLTPLPDITTPVTIDGYTQAGSAPNTINPGFNALVCVGLTQAGTLTHALRAVDGGSLTVRGLWFGNFAAAGAVAVRFDAGSGHVLEGSQFAGILPNGSTINSNRVPVRIGAATNVRIGGPDAAQRNWISGALAQGIAVTNAGIGAQIVIQNNLIGTNSGADGALANGGSGITISNSGGIDILGNLIAGNAGSGISISSGSFGVTIRGNRIGGWLAPSGGLIAQSVPNGSHGIQVLSGSLSVTIGGSESSDAGANDIVANGGAGVMVTDGDVVRIRTNRIFGNGGLGIDLGASGVTPNDPGDGDSGANDLQNFAVLGTAALASGVLTVSGSLDSVAGDYRIDLYALNSGGCDGSSHGEGMRWIGRFDRNLPATGASPFSASLTVPLGVVSVGQSVTATATRLGPTNIGDTSEFSPCLAVVAGSDVLFSNGFESP